MATPSRRPSQPLLARCRRRSKPRRGNGHGASSLSPWWPLEARGQRRPTRLAEYIGTSPVEDARAVARFAKATTPALALPGSESSALPEQSEGRALRVHSLDDPAAAGHFG